jgi:hypothetical protein
MEIAKLVVSPERLAAGNAPATHALVIGISQYRHFKNGPAATALGLEWEMGQLTAAAGSATEIAAWLATEYSNPAAPLGSLRLLVSQSADDVLHPLIAPYATTRATRANVQRAMSDFAADCDRHIDNVAIVYIAGHGVQLTKHNAVVLLEDVADPLVKPSLANAINVTQCHRGMDHGATAGTQFWFVDSCRQDPVIAERFVTMKGAYELDDMQGNANSSSCYLAASSREAAFAERGGRTLFSKALLASLRATAVVPPDDDCKTWHVSSASLGRQLRRLVAEAAEARGETQTVHHLSGGLSPHAVIHRLIAPPRVDLRVRLRPEEAAAVTTAELLLAAQQPVPNLPPGWPLEISVEAGLYLLQLATKPPYRAQPKILDVEPASNEFEATVHT